MSAPRTSQAPKAITDSTRIFSLADDGFTVPAKPTGSPWKLSLPRDHSPTRMKAKTLEIPSLNADLLSVPTMNVGMTRRASCPNFNAPDFSIFPNDGSSRLTSKRPSVQITPRFVPAIQQRDNKKPPSPIRESGLENLSVVSQGNRGDTGDSKLVPKQAGLLSSTMSALFIPKDVASHAELSSKVPSISTPPDTTDSPAPVPVKNKKSYFMRRAVAISNSDVNSMAPTSM